MCWNRLGSLEARRFLVSENCDSVAVRPSRPPTPGTEIGLSLNFNTILFYFCRTIDISSERREKYFKKPERDGENKNKITEGYYVLSHYGRARARNTLSQSQRSEWKRNRSAEEKTSRGKKKAKFVSQRKTKIVSDVVLGVGVCVCVSVKKLCVESIRFSGRPAPART